MSYNGSGTFNINTAGQPVVTGTVISSTAFNALTADLGTGLSTAITKDGQTVATARIPFAAGINSSLVTDATNTTTGSIITAGGVGIAKALFVGTTLNVAGASTLAAITGTFNGTVGATTPATGAFTTLTASSTLTVTGAGSIEGLTVGRGGGAVATNTAVGYQAGYSNTTATRVTAIGMQAGYSGTTGSNYSTYVGYKAGYLTTGQGNVCIGDSTGESLTTGAANTFIGANNAVTGSAGQVITTGSKNTIIGAYNGNQGSLDIRTASNYIVLSDGDGNPRMYFDGSGYIFAPAVFLTVSTALSGVILGTDDVGLFTVSASGQKRIIPRKPNDPASASDNLIDLGDSGSRFRVIYAGTGTINTSDANEKQQIRDLNVAEKAVALRIKSLIKAYKFNDAVALKGDNARIHIGVLAQEVASAFEAEGLDAYKYAMFCSDTWYEVNGNTIDDKNQLVTKDTPNAIARTRMGVRYDELLAFVISAL